MLPAVEREAQVLLEDVRLEGSGVPPAQRDRVEAALGEHPRGAHHATDAAS